VAPFAVITEPGCPRVDVVIPSYTPGHALAELEPGELRAAATLYTDALDIPYRWSAGGTGLKLLRSLHRGTRAHDLDAVSCSALPDPALRPGTVMDWREVRRLTAEDTQRRFILALDQRARYLASCSSVSVGYGDPVHLPLPERAYTGFPGYYRASLKRAPANRVDVLRNVGEWLPAPLFELAASLGRIATVYEAYVWPYHGKYLAPWYARIRAARSYLESAGDTVIGAPAALALVKQTYTAAIGSLAGSWRTPGDPAYRPDWRHAVVALSRANTHRAIRRLIMDAAFPEPFAVDVDAAFFAVDMPTIIRARAIANAQAGRLGGWRIAGTGALSDIPADRPADITEIRAALVGTTRATVTRERQDRKLTGMLEAEV
jgi:hypothetical protein